MLIRDINGVEFVFSSLLNSATSIWETTIKKFPINDVVKSTGTDLLPWALKLVPNTGDEYHFTLSNGNYWRIWRTRVDDTTDDINIKYYSKNNKIIGIGNVMDSQNFRIDKATPLLNYFPKYLGVTDYNGSDYQSITSMWDYETYFDDEEMMYKAQNRYKKSDSDTRLEMFDLWITDVVPPPRYDDDNYSTPDEGVGDFDNTSDVIEQELSDTLIQSAFTTTYQLNTSQLRELYNWLWDDSIITQLDKGFSQPMDAILSLVITPLTPEQLQVGLSREVILARINSGVSGKPLTKGFIRVNMGSITVNEYYGNFLDYAPYTDIECYLPFIGYVKLDTMDVVGSVLTLYYDIDLVNGYFTAYISVDRDRYGTELNAMLYSYSGNMYYNIPITSANYSAMLKSLVDVPISALSGNVPAFASASASLLVASSHPDIRHSGTMSSGSTLTTMRIAFLKITRPRLAIAKSLQKDKGFMCNVTCKLSDLSGYVEVKHVDLTNMSGATENEKSEIENLLNNGVFI